MAFAKTNGHDDGSLGAMPARKSDGELLDAIASYGLGMSPADTHACLGYANEMFVTGYLSRTSRIAAEKILSRLEHPCVGDARGDGYPGTRYFHRDNPSCPGHD